MKALIICFMTGSVGGLLSSLLYDLLSKPDGYLYMDKDTKNIYASLTKDPDEYVKNSRLIFLYKK